MTNEKGDRAGEATAGEVYAERLSRLSGQGWKQKLDVQAPYRANIQRLSLGDTLDVGCGIGRNLAYLNARSVGVDHNPHSVEVARERGLTAYTTDEFLADPALAKEQRYDSLLAAHLVEHVVLDVAVEILGSYLPFVRDGGRIVLICPQESGYKSDSTHVAFTDFDTLRQLSERLGLEFQHEYSFPFPRSFGKVFRYNEFVHISRKPPAR